MSFDESVFGPASCPSAKPEPGAAGKLADDVDAGAVPPASYWRWRRQSRSSSKACRDPDWRPSLPARIRRNDSTPRPGRPRSSLIPDPPPGGTAILLKITRVRGELPLAGCIDGSEPPDDDSGSKVPWPRRSIGNRGRTTGLRDPEDPQSNRCFPVDGNGPAVSSAARCLRLICFAPAWGGRTFPGSARTNPSRPGQDSCLASAGRPGRPGQTRSARRTWLHPGCGPSPTLVIARRHPGQPPTNPHRLASPFRAGPDPGQFLAIGSQRRARRKTLVGPANRVVIGAAAEPPSPAGSRSGNGLRPPDPAGSRPISRWSPCQAGHTAVALWERARSGTAAAEAAASRSSRVELPAASSIPPDEGR